MEIRMPVFWLVYFVALKLTASSQKTLTATLAEFGQWMVDWLNVFIWSCLWMRLCAQETPSPFWSLQSKTNGAGAVPRGLLLSASYPCCAYMDGSRGMVLVVFGIPQRQWSPETFKVIIKTRGCVPEHSLPKQRGNQQDLRRQDHGIYRRFVFDFWTYFFFWLWCGLHPLLGWQSFPACLWVMINIQAWVVLESLQIIWQQQPLWEWNLCVKTA